MHPLTVLTTFLSVFTASVSALPALPQIYLGEEQSLPSWAFNTDPPSLEQNLHAEATKTPVRTLHPFIVPVDSAGRPTGNPSTPSELLIWHEAGS